MKRYFALFVIIASTVLAISASMTVGSRISLRKTRHRAAQIVAPRGAEPTVQAFVKIDDEQALEQLQRIGAAVNSRFKTIATVTVPISQVRGMAALRSIKATALAQNVTLTNDVAMVKSGVNGLHFGSATGLEGTEYTGRGVIVGVIDTGIDFNHVNFRDDDGILRVKAVYLPADETGNHPVIDGNTLPGSEYVTPDEIASLTADNNDTSHGTHTTGTAAGSYRNGFQGVAPQADLVLCGMPEEKFTDANIADAVNYIFNYAQSVGKPAVINLSIGSNDWAHDGTSFLSQVFEEVSGKGRICILSAGNDGNKPVHHRKAFENETDTLRTLLVNPNGYLYNGYVSVWSHTDTPHDFYFTVVNYSTKQTLYRSQMFRNLDPEQVVEISSDSDAELAQYFTGTIYIGAAVEPNGQFHSLFMPIVTAVDRNCYIALHYGAPVGTTIDAWSNSSTYLLDGGFKGYVRGNSEMSISDLATGPSVVSVGAYVTKTVVEAERGTMNYNLSPMDDIAAFSSYGPDARGNRLPDVCAPGYVIESSYSRYDTKSRQYGKGYSFFENVDGVEYPYGTIYGTSMSTPVVAGAVAVWLQVKPDLTAAQIKDILANSSLSDEYVTAGNPQMWGYGKLDVAEGLRYLISQSDGPTVIDDLRQSPPALFPNPNRGEFVIETDNSQPISVSIYSLDGACVYSNGFGSSRISLNLAHLLSPGLYIVRIKGGNNNEFVTKMIIN